MRDRGDGQLEAQIATGPAVEATTSAEDRAICAEDARLRAEFDAAWNLVAEDHSVTDEDGGESVIRRAPLSWPGLGGCFSAGEYADRHNGLRAAKAERVRAEAGEPRAEADAILAAWREAEAMGFGKAARRDPAIQAAVKVAKEAVFARVRAASPAVRKYLPQFSAI